MEEGTGWGDGGDPRLEVQPRIRSGSSLGAGVESTPPRTCLCPGRGHGQVPRPCASHLPSPMPPDTRRRTLQRSGAGCPRGRKRRGGPACPLPAASASTLGRAPAPLCAAPWCMWGRATGPWRGKDCPALAGRGGWACPAPSDLLGEDEFRGGWQVGARSLGGPVHLL